MKKLFLLICLFTLFGCKVGDFPENRTRLHEMGHERDICDRQPDRCIKGVQW